jgi:hypothetical protein
MNKLSVGIQAAYHIKSIQVHLGQLQVFMDSLQGQLQVFKFMFPHGLASSIVLCSKKHKIELLHFFYVALDALFRSSNLHFWSKLS